VGRGVGAFGVGGAVESVVSGIGGGEGGEVRSWMSDFSCSVKKTSSGVRAVWALTSKLTQLE
jgi:hypothetical protein